MSLQPDRATDKNRRCHDRTKGPGHTTVRGEYLKSGGVPCLIAIDFRMRPAMP